MIIKLRNILSILTITVIAAQLLLTGATHAAGTATVSVEASPSTATTNGDVSLRFYVTPSGAAIYGVSFKVNLGNYTYKSFSHGGTVFTGTSSVVAGDSAGSTTFEIAASHLGSNSSSSRAYIGQVTVKASPSAGTGTVSFSGVEALDVNLDDMVASAANRSFPITAPVGGGGGTTPPPAPSNPKPPTSSPPPPGNVVQNPNPDSNAAIPNDTDNNDPTIVAESAFSESLNKEAEEPQEDSSENEQPSSGTLISRIIIILLSVLIIPTFIYVLYRYLSYKNKTKPLAKPDTVAASPKTISPSGAQIVGQPTAVSGVPSTTTPHSVNASVQAVTSSQQPTIQIQDATIITPDTITPQANNDVAGSQHVE